MPGKKDQRMKENLSNVGKKEQRQFNQILNKAVKSLSGKGVRPPGISHLGRVFHANEGV